MIFRILRVRVDLRALIKLEADLLSQRDHIGLGNITAACIELTALDLAVLDDAKDAARTKRVEDGGEDRFVNARVDPAMNVTEGERDIVALRLTERGTFLGSEAHGSDRAVEFGIFLGKLAEGVSVSAVGESDSQRAFVAKKRCEDARIPSAAGSQLEHVLARLDAQEGEGFSGMAVCIARALLVRAMFALKDFIDRGRRGCFLGLALAHIHLRRGELVPGAFGRLGRFNL